MNSTFTSFAPYLKDPLILIGFFLLTAFSFSRYLVKRKVIGRLPSHFGYSILRLILLYGFIIGFLIVLLGFALKYIEIENQRRSITSIEQILRDALKGRSDKTAEEKEMIINQVLTNYRNGTISKEKIERIIQEYSTTTIPVISNIKTMPSLSPNDTNGMAKTERHVPETLNTASQPPIMPSIGSPSITEQSGMKRTGSNEHNIVTPIVIPLPLSRAAKYYIVIERPTPNAIVNRLILVNGKARIPINSHLWAFVSEEESNQWLPLRVSYAKNNNWKAGVELSRYRENGKLTIALVAVTEETNTHLTKLVQVAKPTERVRELPTSAEGCNIETVSVNKAPCVTIIEPKEGDLVRIPFVVSGTAQVPAKSFAWLIIRDVDNNWWLQSKITLSVNDNYNRWRVSINHIISGKLGINAIAVIDDNEINSFLSKQWEYMTTNRSYFPLREFPGLIINNCGRDMIKVANAPPR